MPDLKVSSQGNSNSTLAYKRCYSIVINDGFKLYQTSKKQGLAIDFRVKKSLASDSKKSSNTLELKIYNLSKDNLQKLYNDQIITMSCGYNDKLGVIFSGVITNIQGSSTGADTCTIIQAKESIISSLADWDKKALTIKAGSTFKDAIEAICVTMVAAYPSITDYKIDSIPTTQIVRDTHLLGDPFESIWSLLQPYGMIYYVNSGTIWIVPGRGKQQYLTTEVSAKSGLIGSPQKIVDRKRNRKDNVKSTKEKVESTGWQFTTLLNPVLEIGDRINLTLPSAVKDNFGNLITNYPTLQINNLVFQGNSFNGKWQVIVTALDVPLPPSIAPLNVWENPVTPF